MEIELEINVEHTPDERVLKAKIQAAQNRYQFHRITTEQIFKEIKEKREMVKSCNYWATSEEGPTWRDVYIAQLQRALYVLYGLKSLDKSPLDEIDEQITLLHYRIKHGCNTIAEEKHLIREIKEANRAREEIVVTDPAEKAEMSALGSKEAIQDKIKSMAAEREIQKKADLEFENENKRSLRKIEAIDIDITSLFKKFEAVELQKEKAYRTIQRLRRTLEDLQD